MPRPSLKEQRKNQILDAYENCVVLFGIEGATLEKTAEKAGLARALIRHNIGNREDLKTALVSRFLEKSARSSKEIFSGLKACHQAKPLIKWLFDPAHADPKLVLLSEALIAASAHDPALCQKMRQWIQGFLKDMQTTVAAIFPKADEEAVEAVAAGLTGIYFNIESLSPLGRMPDILKASEMAAIKLLQTLEE